MTALAAPMMNGHESGAENGTEHSPNRFTAVNGRESAPANGPMHPGDRGGPEKPGPDTSQRHESRANLTSDQDQGQASPRSSSPNPHHKNKRKRSESRDQDSSIPEGANASPVNRSAEIHHSNQSGSTAGSVVDMERGNHSATPSHRSDGNDMPQTSANSPWSEYDSQLITQAQRAQQMDPSDAHLADALQREAGHERPGASRSTPGAQQASSPGYGPDRHGALQVAPKRKRVFSNRTKTGCMTCRRRKKKCDEQHPACNNCLRGGFLCEGYSSRSTWQKPSSAKTPVPLQSKEGYSDMNGPYMQETPRHPDRQPSMPEHVEPIKIRPLGTEDNERPVQQYTTSPTITATTPGWSKQPWPPTQASHPPYAEPVSKPSYHEVPSIRELSIDSRHKPDYPGISSMRDISHAPHPKTTMPMFQGGVEQRTLPPAAMDVHSPQAQARLALNMEHHLSGRPAAAPAPTGDETEKEKMLKGGLYRPFDVHLVEDRDRCRGALWRFNNASNPLAGVSSKEQSRLLKEIIIPPASSVSNSPVMGVSRSVGSIGQGVVVEAPFMCHYGYNIHLGEDVLISENCLFVDDCVIRVGAHTWIGPGVKVLSACANGTMQERKGSQSRYQGRQVTIEEDCYVGAGAVIYPGVRLNRGVYVGAGEIVKTDIVAYGFQGQKPTFM